MMTPTTDTTDETTTAPCPAFLVFEVRAASGTHLIRRAEVVCSRGEHPAGTPHHGAATETGELVKWRADALPTTTPQLADPRPIQTGEIVEVSLMSGGGPEHGVHPIEVVTPAPKPARTTRKRAPRNPEPTLPDPGRGPEHPA